VEAVDNVRDFERPRPLHEVICQQAKKKEYEVLNKAVAWQLYAWLL
jgi:hypothetical protein